MNKWTKKESELIDKINDAIENSNYGEVAELHLALYREIARLGSSAKVKYVDELIHNK